VFGFGQGLLWRKFLRVHIGTKIERLQQNQALITILFSYSQPIQFLLSSLQAIFYLWSYNIYIL